MEFELGQTRYRHVVESVFRQPWAILPEKLRAIAELVAMRVDGFRVDPQAAAEVAAAARKGPNHSTGATAVIPMFGTIMYRVGPMEEMSGAVSLQQFQRAFDAALGDDRIKSIVVPIDSPGGQVTGVPETAAKIFNARGKKPMTAVIDGIGASAAYWLGRAFEELTIIPSGMAGSVGVYMLHEDWSAAAEAAGVKFTFVEAPTGGFKTEGNEYNPLSADALDYFQGMVDETYGWFTRDLARFAGVSETKVREDFGRGRVFHAQEAMKRGMVDRVATLDEVLQRHGGATTAVQMASNSVSRETAQWSQREHELASELIEFAAEAQEANAS